MYPIRDLMVQPIYSLNEQIRCSIRYFAIGSLEIGKDADFTIWSAGPLSTYARCEQTWIEGARCFDLDADQALRGHAQTERQRLIQKALADEHGDAASATAATTETGPDDNEPADTRPSTYSCCHEH